MIAFGPTQRYYLYQEATDMRKSFDGLSGLVRRGLGCDPLSGDVFVFINRRRTHIKLRYPDVRVYHDGDGIQIRIRGSRQAPLYILDGVPMAPTASVLLGINPEAIEDVSVLKGPAATMLYGSRARNGVVIFTTKRR